ncbi:MAG: DUF11 domain-containing protein, partial [Anaerolineae bacterium]
MAARSTLTHDLGLNRSGHTVSDYRRAIRAVAAVIGASVFLVCACARQEPPTATPTHTPPPTNTRTPAPIRTLTSVAAATSLPSTPSAIDLAIQSPGLVQVVPGETTVYTLTLRNHGPDLATSIVLTDVLPPGLIPLWAQPAHPVCERGETSVSCDAGDLQGGEAITVTVDLSVGGTGTGVTSAELAGVSWGLSGPACAIDEGTTLSSVACRLDSLQPGAQTHVRLGVTVDAGMAGALVHTASVAANEADTNRSNNSTTFTMTVGGKGPARSEPVASIPAPTVTGLALEADGPARVIAGQLFTYTYTIANRGTLDATGVRFAYVLPPATILHSYAPDLFLCQQRKDVLTCTLRDPDSGEAVTLTLVITGHAGQPMIIEPDPLTPGWPICTVLKERTDVYVVNCELGELRGGQDARVQLGLIAQGVQERAMVNSAALSANEAELEPLDNTDVTTITVGVRADVTVRSAVSGPAVAGKTL